MNSRDRSRTETFLLVAVTLSAIAVRLFRLDHFSYGLDEILQGYFIQGTWESFWKSLKFDAVHPPLDYLVARFVETVHPADWGRKVPDVVWGAGTVPVLALLVGRRAGRAAGIVAALLLSAAPFHVRWIRRSSVPTHFPCFSSASRFSSWTVSWDGGRRGG